MKFGLNVLVLVLLFSSCSLKKEKKVDNEKPINVILLVGDGMGIAQLSSLYFYKNENTNIDRFKKAGFVKTSSASHKITDSGAGGTAFACGKKTFNNAIGVSFDSLEIKNITEILGAKGYKNGVIATSSITHATPASFYAHSISRGNQEFIAAQLLESEVDFFAAGGLQYFNKRSDSINYYDLLSNNNFVIDTISLLEQINDYDKKYGFLLSEDALPNMLNARGDFLPNATKLGLEYLSKSDSGFFLMVESSQIDWAGHENNSDFLIAEMLDFEKTIGVALDFADKNSNTLVIVVADHETGGFSLSADQLVGEYGDYNTISPSFSTKTHTASMVPILIYGKGAENFDCIMENTEVFEMMIKQTSL